MSLSQAVIKRRERDRRNYAADPEKFCKRAKDWRDAHRKEQPEHTCDLCGERYIPASGNQRRYCPKCTPKCDRVGCPGFGSNMHKANVTKTGIMSFRCKAPDVPPYEGHFSFRGPHGEIAVRLDGEPGRYRYVDRIARQTVETQYDPKESSRRALISTVVTKSWRNRGTRKKRLAALRSSEVQLRKANTLRTTVDRRNAEIARLREDALQNEPMALRIGKKVEAVIPRFKALCANRGHLGNQVSGNEAIAVHFAKFRPLVAARYFVHLETKYAYDTVAQRHKEFRAAN